MYCRGSPLVNNWETPGGYQSGFLLVPFAYFEISSFLSIVEGEGVDHDLLIVLLRSTRDHCCVSSASSSSPRMSSVSTSLRHIAPENSSTTAIAAFRRVPCCVDGRKLASRNARRRALGLRADEKRWGNVKAVTSPDCDGPMTATGRSNVPILSGSEVVERLKAFHENRTGEQNYSAMYSSIFGGITTDSAAMVIPMDDHMVHRGHGVFDTAAIMDGHLYELDQHLDRFLRSASMAKIQLPFDRSTIRSILIQTVSASKCMQGSLRYWLSPGPGDFLLSPSGCPNPALYAIVIEGSSLPVCSGVKVITSSIPMKSQQFAVMKNVNYLPNALSKMEAEENGAFAAIWLDDEGFVAEGPSMNVAFVTADKELLMPYFSKVLSGCTAKRVLSLAEELVADGRLSGIKLRNITVQEGKTAEEMMLIGSGIVVKPVLQWDDHVIGAGEEGPVAQSLFELILDDMKHGPPSVRTSVPY